MTAPCHPEDGAHPSAVGIAWVAHVCRPRGTVVAGPSLRNRGHPRPRGIPSDDAEIDEAAHSRYDRDLVEER
jgi:hypothetical protein